MNQIPKETPIREIINRIISQANSGTWDGISMTPYMNNCRWMLEGYNMGLILTRDVNHHLSGWWKNPGNIRR